MKIFLLLLLSFGTSAQILTIPTGTNVQSNTTSDQVTVNGYLRVTGSLTRGLMIEKDNDDSWVTFHDPNDYWYSMGIDRSNSGNFALNAGGTVGSSNHFVMTGGGKIGIGVSNPQNTMQVFAGNGGASDGLSIYGTNGTSPKLFLAGDAANSIAATLSYNSSSGNLDIAPRAGYNTLFTSGKVGIGGAPKALFDVSSYIPGGTLGSVLGRLQEGDGTGEGTFLGVRGYYTQPTNVKSFAIEHSFWGAVNSSINFSRGVGATGGFIAFNTNDNTEQMRITTSGNVGIGTTTPGSFKLAVEGKIYGKEVQVAINNPGPDYVFEKDYNLPSLDSIKTYIDQNKHLPEVPSAKEMEANGVNLGEMNMVLLKKVEELTLYMIEFKKEKEKIEKINCDLLERVQVLEKKNPQ